MPNVFLRRDQIGSLITQQAYQTDKVVICALEWVRKGLKTISSHITPGIQFDVYDGRGSNKIESLTLDSEISLKQLITISRNEPQNVTGIINFENYEPDFNNRAVVYSLKDLTRQCVIVGKDKTTHYGGYPKGTPVAQNEDVYVTDLAGLQFQRPYNSGRLVLIGRDVPTGVLDDFIYFNVVGENKKSFDDASVDSSGRYLKISGRYFDSVAYKKFVANDFLLAALAVDEFSENDINFKFLKYGTGFFAGSLDMQRILEIFITGGVREGLKLLFSTHKLTNIKSIELPFYESDEGIVELCKTNGIECRFSYEDALKKTLPNLMTAVTNCGDPHVVLGNEMGYSSVDAAIGENLESRGHIFSPNINKLMETKFFPFNIPEGFARSSL